MTRLESSVPDSSALAAAARRNRSEGYGKAFDSAMSWLDRCIKDVVQHVGAYAPPAAQRRHLSH